jgi:hypothetical protein
VCVCVCVFVCVFVTEWTSKYVECRVQSLSPSRKAGGGGVTERVFWSVYPQGGSQPVRQLGFPLHHREIHIGLFSRAILTEEPFLRRTGVNEEGESLVAETPLGEKSQFSITTLFIHEKVLG